MKHSSVLFTPCRIKKLTLKNRITMAPMFVGYATQSGKVSAHTLEHYRSMAASGAAMIVVENTAVHPTGVISPTSLRIDDEMYLPGLAELAATIHEEGALAFLQISHAGRLAYTGQTIAPSPVKTGDMVPIEMAHRAVEAMIEFFASAANLVKQAGFDGIEIDGGGGYLLSQFLSPRTNLRSDELGGPLENRMQFPLRIVDAVMREVGSSYPVGYRLLADEGLPDGLHIEESSLFARELERSGVAYLSVTAGSHEVLYLPEYMEWRERKAHMAPLAAAVKEAVAHTPIIVSGGIRTPEVADEVLESGAGDLIGLARALFADPLWPKKAAGEVDGAIIPFDRACSLCTKRALIGLPAYCSKWDRDHRREFLERAREREEKAA